LVFSISQKSKTKIQKIKSKPFAPPNSAGYTSLHTLHRSTSARSPLKHTFLLDFWYFQSLKKSKQKSKKKIQALCPTKFCRVYIPTYPTQVYTSEKPAETHVSARFSASFNLQEPDENQTNFANKKAD